MDSSCQHLIKIQDFCNLPIYLWYSFLQQLSFSTSSLICYKQLVHSTYPYYSLVITGPENSLPLCEPSSGFVHSQRVNQQLKKTKQFFFLHLFCSVLASQGNLAHSPLHPPLFSAAEYKIYSSLMKQFKAQQTQTFQSAWELISPAFLKDLKSLLTHNNICFSSTSTQQLK